ncbi:hypothetical protein RN001_014553 [Aquatica leii]|uniref:Uncharacterized protein n=1 Tax=Aquatica leii TaxID=1421715 RepID=A0AAN7PNJ8_9COLE|nr:hypothetical protein RN001_014553 [Aquatica leii]
MSRNTRTNLPCNINNLKPKLINEEAYKNCIQAKQTKQSEYYNKKFGARELDLIKPNTKVWVQTTPNSNWQKGVIMSRIDDRRYKVSLETGSTLVRNRIFIKPSIMNNNVATNKTVRWYDEVDRRKVEKEYSCNLQKCELNSFKETNETMSYNLSDEDIGSSKLSRPSTNKEPDVSLNQAANHLVSRSGRSIKTPVRLNLTKCAIWVAEQKLSDNVPSSRPSTSTSAFISLGQNQAKSNKRKLSDIDSTFESSDEDLSLHDTSGSEDVPDLSTSFNEILITPDLDTRKTKVVRKKSLNYRAQEVTKALFQERDLAPGISD